MSQAVDESQMPEEPTIRVRSIEDFCRRYRLDENEQIRLTKRFGHFAAEADLLMTAMRHPAFR